MVHCHGREMEDRPVKLSFRPILLHRNISFQRCSCFLLIDVSMFSAIFGTMHNLQPIQPDRGGLRDDPNMPPHPLILLQQLFNPQNAAQGDAVFSQEALDRVISQLMEQNAGSNAPGPAPEDAIKSLPKRPVEESMLGNDGQAECSICMESVSIGEEVTFLPCKHWFHEQCVTAWLKEHDTCPHCRQGITKPPATQTEPGRPNNPRRMSRNQSSAPTWNSSPESSRQNPMSIPENPMAERGHDSYYDRAPRPSPSTRPSRSDSRRSGESSNSGVTGWLRNHNPFGSGSS